ncbi:tRNA pseudouridine synthase A [Eumeta japonica]|uniref:tRNA pseudouridine synthase A n=1 Tax=Eumeta variegata TaxID=151549 RepID=A0A4C1TIL6_EUMVA|nr:tRNA pseudouridine synthase A [Eumeta japonica]
MMFNCSQPFQSPQGVEFVTLKHPRRALTEERLDLPMAPGLGLVLDTVHYRRYNERYSQDGIHNPLLWEKQEPEIQEFIEKKILDNIYRTECEQKPLLEWLETLPLHSYDQKGR